MPNWAAHSASVKSRPSREYLSDLMESWWPSTGGELTRFAHYPRRGTLLRKGTRDAAGARTRSTYRSFAQQTQSRTEIARIGGRVGHGRRWRTPAWST